MKSKGTKNLTYTQRLILEQCLNAGLRKKDIAQKLGVHISTVYNEIKRGLCLQKKIKSVNWLGEKNYKHVEVYSPELAEEKYRIGLTAHGRPIKLGKDYAFVEYVEKRVLEGYSPCAICGEIKRKNLFQTQVSKTTLYRYISMGFFLHISMENCPLHKKKKRYRKIRAKRPPRGTSIEQRPKDILRRDTFGNWEMDCIIGKSKETLLTLVERQTRRIILFKMPNKKPESVVSCLDILERRYGSLFPQVFKSITVDNGVEFSDCLGMQRSIYNGQRTVMYYCHPYCSSERGSNERLNREVRRKLPKGSNFSHFTDIEIQAIENWVNNYPRGIFGFATSAELFDAKLASV